MVYKLRILKGYKKLNKNKQEKATEMYEVYKAWNIYYPTCFKKRFAGPWIKLWFSLAVWTLKSSTYGPSPAIE